MREGEHGQPGEDDERNQCRRGHEGKAPMSRMGPDRRRFESAIRLVVGLPGEYRLGQHVVEDLVARGRWTVLGASANDPFSWGDASWAVSNAITLAYALAVRENVVRLAFTAPVYFSKILDQYDATVVRYQPF